MNDIQTDGRTDRREVVNSYLNDQYILYLKGLGSSQRYRETYIQQKLAFLISFTNYFSALLDVP